MGILALDPSILHLGWAAMYNPISGESTVLYQYGTIIAPPELKDKPLIERAHSMLREVSSIRRAIDNGKEMSITKIIIEKPEPWGSYKSLASSRSGSLEMLTIFTGILAGWGLSHLGENGVVFIKVSQWKGQLPKHVTKKRMEKKYPVTFKTTDEADAAGLGDWYLTRERK